MKSLVVATLVFVSLVSGSQARADTVHCSDASGELMYTAFRYSGGAPPYAGMVAFEERYLFRGEVIGHMRECFDGGVVDPAFDGCASFAGEPFAATWGAKTVLAQEATQFETKEVYASFLSGAGIPAITYSAYVICESTRYHLAP